MIFTCGRFGSAGDPATEPFQAFRPTFATGNPSFDTPLTHFVWASFWLRTTKLKGFVMDQQIEKKQSPKDANLLAPEIPYLRRYARALTRNAADADDLVQNALMRAVANFARFEQGTNLRAWLLTIVHNAFIDGTRKLKRERESHEMAEERMSGLFTSPNQMAALQIGELETALARLPEEQRITLILVALEDMSYEEAAKVTGVPIGTVRSRLSRAPCRHGHDRRPDDGRYLAGNGRDAPQEGPAGADDLAPPQTDDRRQRRIPAQDVIRRAA